MIEFVREFNVELEKLKQYNQLNYMFDGENSGIQLPSVFVFTDSDSSVMHHNKVALINIMKIASNWNEVAHNMFAEEMWAWEKEIKEQLIKKFPNSKMNLERTSTLRYKLIISGKYNEDSMQQFVENVVEEFEYMFNGCKMDAEW